MLNTNVIDAVFTAKELIETDSDIKTANNIANMISEMYGFNKDRSIQVVWEATKMAYAEQGIEL